MVVAARSRPVAQAPAFLRPHKVDSPAVRLVVFPHAGGSAAGYRPLSRLLPADWDVLLHDLPGHGQRHHQPPLGSMAEVLLCALGDLRPWHSATPLALFGHSYGAVVAYEVAQALQELGHPPVWLGVSGRCAPAYPAPSLCRLYDLDDRRLTDELIALGGLPAVLTEVPELLERFLGPVRSDLRALEAYRPRPDRARLACALSVFGGAADPLAPPAGLPGWRAEAAGPFRLWQFPGGHFDLLDAGVTDLAGRLVADATAAARA